MPVLSWNLPPPPLFQRLCLASHQEGIPPLEFGSGFVVHRSEERGGGDAFMVMAMRECATCVHEVPTCHPESALGACDGPLRVMSFPTTRSTSNSSSCKAVMTPLLGCAAARSSVGDALTDSVRVAVMTPLLAPSSVYLTRQQ